MRTILGIFTDQDDANHAIDDLQDAGYDPRDVSIISRKRTDGVTDTGATVAEGTAAGATTGAVAGGIAGLLSAYVLPGLGAFFIGGPIAAALGLTGAAALAVSGAATGAAAGGILGALTGLGLSTEDAQKYEARINDGDILVAVPADAGEVAEVKRMLVAHGAEDIQTTSRSFNGYETTADEVADEEMEEYKTHGDVEDTFAAGAKGGRRQRRKK
jgi:hypothetical protein